jgi:hypothetical protein
VDGVLHAADSHTMAERSAEPEVKVERFMQYLLVDPRLADADPEAVAATWRFRFGLPRGPVWPPSLAVETISEKCDSAISMSAVPFRLKVLDSLALDQTGRSR